LGGTGVDHSAAWRCLVNYNNLWFNFYHSATPRPVNYQYNIEQAIHAVFAKNIHSAINSNINNYSGYTRPCEARFKTCNTRR
jgi:hypothetical protein